MFFTQLKVQLAAQMPFRVNCDHEAFLFICHLQFDKRSRIYLNQMKGLLLLYQLKNGSTRTIHLWKKGCKKSIFQLKSLEKGLQRSSLVKWRK